MPRKSPQSFPTPKKKRPAKKPTADRARFLIDQCPHKITGVVQIPGLQILPPEHESNLENCAIKLLALCIDVIGIESQAQKITWADAQGKPRKYTIDSRITLDTSELVWVESKPIGEIVKEEMLEKLITVARCYADNHQRFDILSDEAICIEPRLSIAIRLRGFLTQSVPEGTRADIEQLLADDAKPIRSLLQTLGGDHFWSHILALIAQRVLCISWDEEFSKDMRVSLPNQPFGHLTYAAIADTGRFRPLLQDVVLGRRPTDQQLLAAARAQDRSVPLPSPMGVVGELPARAMQVGRAERRVKDGGDGDVLPESTGAPDDASRRTTGGLSHDA